MPDIFAGMERELGHYLHRHNHPVTITGTQEHPQENHMSYVTEAKAAIDHAAQQLAFVAANPLADAIAGAGVGQSFTPKDVQLALAVLGAIDKFGPGTNAAPLTPQAPAQQQDARDLQPQQPA